MTMTKEELFKIAGINSHLDIQPATPSKPIRYTENQHIIDDKRAELELKKLEIEIEKLSAPNTSIDYFKEMLSLQQNHFNQMLEMEKQHQKLALEIERMKLLSETEGDEFGFMGEILKPLIPKLLEQQGMKGGETKPPMDINQYAKAIQDGQITETMAYEDFKLERPELAKLTPYETFKKNFDYMKTNGKPPEKVIM